MAETSGILGKEQAEATEAQEKKFQCKICKRPSLTYCANCQEVFYCSQDHQAIDWPTHKMQCINSVKYLQAREVLDKKKKLEIDRIKHVDNEYNDIVLVGLELGSLTLNLSMKTRRSIFKPKS